jgi:hypothetical protein
MIRVAIALLDLSRLECRCEASIAAAQMPNHQPCGDQDDGQNEEDPGAIGHETLSPRRISGDEGGAPRVARSRLGGPFHFALIA